MRIAVLLWLAVMLSACSFQLQTQQSFPAGLSPMAFTSEVPVDSFYEALTEVFAQESLRVSQRTAEVLLTVHELDYLNTRIGQFDAVSATLQWSLVNPWGESVVYKKTVVERAEVQRSLDAPDAFSTLTEQVNRALVQSMLAEFRRLPSDEFVQQAGPAS